MQKDELLVFLQDHNVPLHEWGTGEAKTFDHLLLEISLGESELTEKDGKVLRSAEGSMLNVYYYDGQATWVLIEEKQVFTDGRSRTRNLDPAIGEKMRPGETPEDGAYRALSEELGITEKLPLIPKPLRMKGPVPSQSYPGLWSVYSMHIFDVFLPEHLYKPEGYEENQSDKTSYFVWEKLPHTGA